jgi:hypothetical protein
LFLLGCKIPLSLLSRHIKGDKYMEEKEIIKTQQDRIRINISTSVKGIKTYDCTVETHEGMAVALRMSDTLIEQLDERYPAGG